MQGTPKSQNHLEKNKDERVTLPDFKTYHKTRAINTVLFWHRHTDQWNRTKNPEINPYLYGQLIFKRVPRPFNTERIIFLTHGTETPR